tara:strand:- start:43 stop:438 length:396 start_codon:yes stop_codon:yes gene_type:complete
MNNLCDLPGADALESWFGFFPTFHDAEVVNIDLNRDPSPSVIRIKAFSITDKIDNRGYFVLENFIFVDLVFTGIYYLSISDWNHQNVLSGISVVREDFGYALSFEATFGLDGKISARTIEIKLNPFDASDI